MKRRDFLQLSAGSVAAALVPARAGAQGDYPDRAIKIIVPRAAGGIADIVAREWSGKIGKSLGTTFIENMGGGGGVIGAAAAARATPDGYTLLVGTTSELVISPLLSPQSYDPVTSFEPVAIVCDSPAAIVVHPSVPASNLKELVAYAKKNEAKLSYGSAGAGTVSNLAGELFKAVAGLPGIVHVPYKGGGPAVADAIAGQVLISTPMISEQLWELHRQGKLKVLAVAADRRLDAIPDLPTAAEQGYPDLLARLFFGLFAPAKTPKPIIARLEQVTRVALQDPELKKTFAAGGVQTLDIFDSTAAADYVAKEVTRWKPILAQFKPQ